MNLELSQQLTNLRLNKIKETLKHQEEQPDLYSDLSFYDRLSLLLGDEITARENKKVERLTKQAKFRLKAHPNQIDYRASRGLDKSRVRSVLEGHWLQHHQNLIITGATGSGKTYLGCAIGHYACQQGIPVRYFRLKGLQVQLKKVHSDGTYARFLNQLNATPIVMLDDWGMETLTKEDRSDLLDIIDGRYKLGSMILMSQLPVSKWHELIGESTYADAIMDRLIHSAQRFELNGKESMRKETNNLTDLEG
jgi:DNA replication protein DnaC